MIRLKQGLIVFAFTLIYCSHGHAAFEPKGWGVVYIAGGYSGIASTDAAFAVFVNPAKLVFIPESRVGIFYRNFYQLADLNQITLSAATRLWEMPFAFGINRFGNHLYAESELRLAAAYKIWPSLTVGGALHFYHLRIERYGSAASWGFLLSFLYHISPQLSAAFLAANLNEPRLGAAQEPIPFYGSLGITYRINEALCLNLDFFQQENQPFDYRFGIHFRIQNWFTLISGFREITNSFNAGFDVNYKALRIGYAFEYHSTLGVNHSVSTSYEF